MKKFIVYLVLVLFAALSPLFAQAKPSEKPFAKPAKEASSQKMAFLFHFEDLVGAAGPYSDGFQTGAGFKYWYLPNIAARALLGVLVDPDPLTDTSTTTLSFSAAAEIHLKTGKASPYVGGILGTKFLIEPDTTYMDYFLGAIGGVELQLIENLSIFAEYQALMTSTIDGIGFELGNQAVLGLAIYF